MKVIYKETIYDKIKEEIEHAVAIGKDIDKIILSQEEWDEHVQSSRTVGVTHAEMSDYLEKAGVTIWGVKAEKEEDVSKGTSLFVYHSVYEAQRAFELDICRYDDLFRLVSHHKQEVVYKDGSKGRYIVLGSYEDLQYWKGFKADAVFLAPGVDSCLGSMLKAQCERN